MRVVGVIGAIARSVCCLLGVADVANPIRPNDYWYRMHSTSLNMCLRTCFLLIGIRSGKILLLKRC